MYAAIVLLLLLPASALAYGEAADGWPSPQERALHFFTDRLRVAPDATDPQFGTYAPVRPLIRASELNESARFYADDMAAHGCFPADHSSCDGTAFGDRLGAFYAGQAIGENILYGLSSPEDAVFDGWLYSEGHRENMLSDTWVELGTGFAAGRPHWVQDFGLREGVVEPIATSGTHWPLTGSGTGSSRYFVAVYDPDGPVDGVDLLLDEARIPMGGDRGDAQSGTWVAEADNDGDACRSYAFEVRRGDGSTARYPQTGWLQATVGGEACAAWINGDGAPGGSLGSGGAGCNERGGNAGGPGSNQQGGNVQLGSCSVGSGGRVPGLLALALLALAARRRR